MLQLKRARKLAGLTVEQLAYKAGISQHHVSRLEHGHHVPLITTLQKLATALGVQVQDLTAGDLQDQHEQGREQAAPPPHVQHREGE